MVFLMIYRLEWTIDGTPQRSPGSQRLPAASAAPWAVRQRRGRREAPGPAAKTWENVEKVLGGGCALVYFSVLLVYYRNYISVLYIPHI